MTTLVFRPSAVHLLQHLHDLPYSDQFLCATTAVRKMWEDRDQSSPSTATDPAWARADSLVNLGHALGAILPVWTGPMLCRAVNGWSRAVFPRWDGSLSYFVDEVSPGRAQVFALSVDSESAEVDRFLTEKHHDLLDTHNAMGTAFVNGDRALVDHMVAVLSSASTPEGGTAGRVYLDRDRVESDNGGSEALRAALQAHHDDTNAVVKS